jgi:hypothetical protein
VEDVALDRSWAPWVAGGIIALLCIAALVAYALTSGGDDRRTAIQVIRGAACDDLIAASAALRSGERDTLNAALSSAADAAIASLQRSDMRFGAPERVALKLESVRLEAHLSRRARLHIMQRLEVARQACRTLAS